MGEAPARAEAMHDRTDRRGLQQRRRVLAVASGGGHWSELMRILPAFEGCELAFVTVDEAYRHDVAEHRFYQVLDATRWNRLGILWQAACVLGVVLRERPEVVISTGAAPGYFALRFGKWAGARTIWLDSIANVERLSLAGEKAGRFADVWLTQWPHLAREGGPHYSGAVL
jgi:UDP-N-acetylglucosamine:LPS N-acetylglucosamine transferase